MIEVKAKEAVTPELIVIGLYRNPVDAAAQRLLKDGQLGSYWYCPEGLGL